MSWGTAECDRVKVLFSVSLRIGIVVLKASTASIGICIGVLILLRLTKSGIEYVILAGSSFFPLSNAESRFLTVEMVDLARAARDFFKDLGLWGT